VTASREQLPVKDTVVRPFKRGDEAGIVRLLNFCFGDWGTVQKWQRLYFQCPNFEKDDVFVIEKNDEIIGYEGLHSRDMVIKQNYKLRTVSLRDAAIHPRYRRRGLHARLLEMMLEAAKSRGAGLVFSWYLRGSGLHAHSKDIGFIEIKQPLAYVKVIKPEKVLRSGLLDLLIKSQTLRETLQDFDGEIFFRFGKSEFSVAELLGNANEKPAKDQRKVEMIFEKGSLVMLAKFRNMHKRQRLKCLILLILLRRAKIRFSSFKAFLNLARKGLAVIGSI
jgi:ribosomal protein S18 acetylase RimI-like enzyme